MTLTAFQTNLLPYSRPTMWCVHCAPLDRSLMKGMPSLTWQYITISMADPDTPLATAKLDNRDMLSNILLYSMYCNVYFVYHV